MFALQENTHKKRPVASEIQLHLKLTTAKNTKGHICSRYGFKPFGSCVCVLFSQEQDLPDICCGFYGCLSTFLNISVGLRKGLLLQKGLCFWLIEFLS